MQNLVMLQWTLSIKIEKKVKNLTFFQFVELSSDIDVSLIQKL